MKNLVYKEFKLSINKFFVILPFVLALLLFIPQWIYTIAFSYFFWISVSTIFSAYNAQEDMSFCSTLPVTKRDIVKSKIAAFFILEGLHIVTGLAVGLIHNEIYGSYNFLLDINIAFVGIILGMYSLFNIIFLPMYYKSAYFFGKPVTYASAAALIYAFMFEYGVIRFEFIRNIVEGDVQTQMIFLGVSVIIMIVVNYIAIVKSIGNFESIK